MSQQMQWRRVGSGLEQRLSLFVRLESGWVHHKSSPHYQKDFGDFDGLRTCQYLIQRGWQLLPKQEEL